MAKIIKITTSVLFSIFSVLCLTYHQDNAVLYAESLTTAKSMVVLETTSKRVLYSKNPHQKLANASTTKIATFLTVLKNCNDFDQVVKIDSRAVGIPGTSIYLKKGESLTVKELLLGMMLVSGNDAATALALFISPSVEDFAKKMTSVAHECGAVDSTFKNPHGLDEQGHQTTAYDLALIATECYKYPIFEQIVTTKNAKIKGSTEGSLRYLKNKNRLLHSLQGCNGVKTGFTDDAGRCYVGSAKRDDMQIISVVLNCRPMFEESSALINRAFNEYKMQELLPAYNYIQDIPVKDSELSHVKVYTQRGFSFPLKEEEQKHVDIKISTLPYINSPLPKESVVGNLQIYLGNHLIFSEKIYTMEDVENIKVGSNLKRIISQWWQMRINKYLALCGVASRRKCEDLIKNGQISVNGKIVYDLATQINEKKDKVLYNDQPLNLPTNYVYYKMNKPKGYICSSADEKGRKTIYSLIQSDVRLFSVGRLDYNTEGLIILTNDGDFAQKLAHPANEIEKEYVVKIEGKIVESELAVLRAGVVESNGQRMPKAKVKLLSFENNQSRISVKIHEGQNRQVRRMFEAIGKTITLLKRVSVGEIKLGGLQRGKYKELSTVELAYLLGNEQWKQ